MKRLFKIFGILFVLGTVIGFTSCDSLFGSNEEGEDYSKPINHTFVMEPAQGYNFYYYTSTTRFSYEGHDSCYYQISFSTGSKTWSIYTRPVSSTNKIQDVASGSYTGNPAAEGELVLTDPDDSTYSQTVTIAARADGKLCFTANVAPAHKFLKAKDSK